MQKLTGVLALERRQGCRDRAVIGGLDAFVERWLAEADPEVRADVRGAVAALRGYGQWPPETRAGRLEEIDQLVRQVGYRTARVVSGRPASEAAPAAAPEGAGEPPLRGAARAPEVDRPLVHLRGIGQRSAEKLERLGLRTVRDLLYHAPARYNDFRLVRPIAELQRGDASTVVGAVWDVRGRALPDGRHVLTVVLNDTTATVACTFFNQPFLEREFRPGRRVVVSGPVDVWAGRLVFTSPQWEPVDQDLQPTTRFVPVYPLTQGIGQRWLRRQIRAALDEYAEGVPDLAPGWLLEEHDLMPVSQALQGLHAPADETEIERSLRRLAFDELLTLQVWARRSRSAWRSRSGLSLADGRTALAALMAGLPFEPTAHQRRAVAEIESDLAGDTPMLRLLQGDVGSGKTVVAAAAAAMAVAAGTQAVLMAPTELLADQHLASLQRLLAPLGYRRLDGPDAGDGSGQPGGRRPCLARLVGSMGRAERSAVLVAVREGTVDLLVGTHAVIQAGVTFRQLGLAVVDEQHRFGVLQRAELLAKGSAAPRDESGAAVAGAPDAEREGEPVRGGLPAGSWDGGEHTPHLLIMTATPIPRTLAQTLHADLDQTVISELPPGRKPVTTRWLAGHERERAYEFVRHSVREGGQAYVVFPRVEATEESGRPAAVDEYARLQSEVFPDLALGLLHGRMSAADKEAVMSSFHAGRTQVLVATSVIEVGVDVPNATVILIDGADSFGLAQLHQFRGRVGRGKAQSTCLLLADDPTEAAKERLAAMTRTSDGLELAELDLRLRGPGDYFGLQQAGRLDRFRFARRVGAEVAETARRAAAEVMRRDPDLVSDDTRWLAEAVRSLGSAAERA